MENDSLLPHLRGGSLEDCDLSNSVLQRVIFEGVAMFGADFSNANLDGCEFYLVFAMNSLFKNSSMQRVRICGGNFVDASFFGADLTGASFLADNMGGYVDLSGVNFSNAILDGVTFESVLFSENTKFPENFLLDNPGLIKKKNDI